MTRAPLFDRLQQLLTDPRRELGHWARFLRFQVSLWRFCARRLREHDVMTMSAGLSFRTIFALVPALVLGLLVARALGALEDSQRSLRSFLAASGLAQIVAVQEADSASTSRAATEPAGARHTISVADKIEEVVATVESKLSFARVGPVGGVLLIWSAVGLLTSLEGALNRIFGAARSRAWARRLLLYWSALTLGPVTLATASYIGQRFVDKFAEAPGFPSLLAVAGWVGPSVVGVLVLAMAYKLLPNTHVRYRAAVGGAAVATVMWLLAKWAFAAYVERLVLSGNLYGVLGVVPLFLLWLYYSWLIFLFGAELAHTAVNLEEMQAAELGRQTVLGPTDLLAAALVVAQEYAAGRGPASFDDLVTRLRLPGAAVEALLARLVGAGVLCAVDDAAPPRYVTARPAEQIRVADVLALGDPRQARDAADGYAGSVTAAVRAVHGRLQASLADLTLSGVLGAAERGPT